MLGWEGPDYQWNGNTILCGSSSKESNLEKSLSKTFGSRSFRFSTTLPLWFGLLSLSFPAAGRRLGFSADKAPAKPHFATCPEENGRETQIGSKHGGAFSS